MVRRVREGYDAFNRGDYEAVLENWHADAAVHDREEVPDPRDYTGFEGAREAFANVIDMFDEYVIEPVEIIEREPHILAVLRQRGRGRTSGVLVEDDIVHVWTVRDGKVADLRGFSTKEDALEHLGWPSS
jgi:uncharacterized protein